MGLFAFDKEEIEYDNPRFYNPSLKNKEFVVLEDKLKLPNGLQLEPI